MTAPTLDRETILQAIRQWPSDDQVALAQQILRRASAYAAPEAREPQRPTSRELAGLAAVPGKEPPTDEEVARWLDEHRMEKYGG
jgi:hypothetical protein